ncbi:MAG: 3-deoxy-manno-octulosonate cytidylyltransferase [Gammaproteobacteria bacterium]|nr:3-deoxy-manno-octulosonate cytidylyltransferase [Gammaproteobacteria bacterium]
MKIIAIIPARMGSSRFPGKPLADINGMPMIGHCYKRTELCTDLDDSYVATCDAEIFDYIRSIGGKAIMTSDKHERASDRSAEAMLKIEEEIGQKVDIVVMVQGDEPMITPNMITESIEPFKQDSSVNVVNLMAKMNSLEEFNDPNEVKVVVDKNSNALYFSREPIPSDKKWSGEIPMLKQVCIIPFRREYLLKFNDLEETILEKIESVDMMRVLENGENVKMVFTNSESYSVDTIADLEKVKEYLLKDNIIHNYM